MAIYYVNATSGSDAANGTSAGTAWQTMSKVISFKTSTGYYAGDSILFNRGDTFASTAAFFLNGMGGSSGNPIFIGAYGSGAKPILTTKVALPGWNTSGNWTNMGSNVWRKSITYTWIPRIWLNGTEYARAETYTDITSTKRTSITAGDGYIYVYATSNPATFYSLIEYPSIEIATIRLDNFSNYVTLDNLDIQCGEVCSISLGYCSFTIIQNCIVGKGSSRNGIHTNVVLDYVCYNNVIDSGCILAADFAQTQGGDGIHLERGSKRWEVYRNTIRNWSHACFELTIYGSGTIEDIHVYENIMESPDVEYCRGIGCDLLGGTNVVFERNLIRDNSTSIQLQAESGLVFMYNLVLNTRNTTSREQGAGGINIAGYATHPQNMRITNNVIANNHSYGIVLAGTLSNDGSYLEVEDNIFSNNIFYNNGHNVKNAVWYPTEFTTGVQLYIRDDLDVLNNTFQNNLFYYSGVTDLIYYGHDTANDYPHTVAEFNAENGTASDVISGNINADPLFVDPDDNFELQVGSPAAAAGLDLGSAYDDAIADGSTWPNGVTTVVQSTLWDIGAYKGDVVPTGTKILAHVGNILARAGNILIN